MSNRRTFLQRAFGLGAGLFAAQPLLASATDNHRDTASAELIKRANRRPTPGFNRPTITVDVGDAPYTMDGDTKVFRLTAQVIRRQIAPNKTITLWGYNGSSPGPTIQVNQGDHVRVIVRNELPEPTSLHWHGFEDAIGFDGMPGISQEPILPGEEFTYEFHIHQTGTYFYHSHMAMQEMAGMLGAFIMHPRVPYHPSADKDFVLHFQEYAVLPNNIVPDTMKMEFNWLTINGRSGPAITPLIIRQGDYVRIRMINLGMDHHPIHIHGHTFYVTGTEGGRIPESAWWPGNTVLVGVAQARDVEFVANNPGDWMLHCHLPHHMMNQMAQQAGPMTRRDFPAYMQRGMQQNMQGLSPLQQQNMMAMDMSPRALHQQAREIAPNANEVPGFPQDAYMEGPMMDMERDPMLQMPELYGMRPGWSRYFQGMMTLMRVLPPDQYDAVVTRMRQANRPNDPYASILGGDASRHTAEGA